MEEVRWQGAKAGVCYAKMATWEKFLHRAEGNVNGVWAATRYTKPLFPSFLRAAALSVLPLFNLERPYSRAPYYLP